MKKLICFVFLCTSFRLLSQSIWDYPPEINGVPKNDVKYTNVKVLEEYNYSLENETIFNYWVSTQEFDSNGLITKEYIDSDTLEFEYDNSGRKWIRILKKNNNLTDTTKREFIYDTSGNLISYIYSTNDNAEKTNYFYNHRNKLIEVKNQNERTEITYDANDSIKSIVKYIADVKREEKVFSYFKNRISYTTSFFYNGINTKDSTVGYYDRLRRLKRIEVFNDLISKVEKEIIEIKYDKNGRLFSYLIGCTHIDYIYDHYGNLISIDHYGCDHKKMSGTNYKYTYW